MSVHVGNAESAPPFSEAAHAALGDRQLRANVRNATDIIQAKRNRMTGELVEQQNRALQAERVAAWRELARRFADLRFDQSRIEPNAVGIRIDIRAGRLEHGLGFGGCAMVRLLTEHRW